MSRPDTLCALVLAAASLLVACNDSGTSTARKPYFGPGSAPATPASGTGAPPVITGPNGQPDDHGNDIMTATFVASATLGVPPIQGSGALDYRNDIDVFQFYLNAGTYDFSTQTTGDTLLTLLDAGGNQIAQNDDEDRTQNKLNSLIAGQQINVTGIYYMAVGEGFNAGSQALPVVYTVNVQ